MLSSNSGTAPIRTTQRAPRSCISCAKRRRRCDKKIPCQQCINRGLESDCMREVVKVKGQVIADSKENSDTQHKPPSYHQLLEENRHLKSQLLQPLIQLEHRDSTYKEGRNITESFEKDLFEAVMHTNRKTTVSTEESILWPEPACASILLSYGKIWTSWIHCALHQPTFEIECSQFWKNGTPPCSDELKPLWLAVYFGFMSAVLLFMDEEEASECGIPQDVGSSMVNWYDAAIFYLYKGDFLRNYDIRSVQAIVILGIVFNNVGDSVLHSSLWGCALRIARALKMGLDHENSNESIVQTEVRRRLWWTLVLCEWIPIPYRIPCIYEADFQVELPRQLDDDELTISDHVWKPKPRSIQYHIAMIQLSIIYHRFRCSLRLCNGSAEEVSALVVSTDESLANLISHLPEHLQNDERFGTWEDQNNQERPWILWQRTNISLVLCYYRIAVNRVLQDQWVQEPITFARTRSICLGSAQGIINLVRSYTGPIARYRPWATSTHIFSAAIILIVETRYHSHDAQDKYMDEIAFCIDFLNITKDQSILASHALQILKSQLHTTGQDC